MHGSVYRRTEGEDVGSFRQVPERGDEGVKGAREEEIGELNFGKCL